MEVTLGQQCETLGLVVAEGDGPSLMGRDWLHSIRLDWPRLHLLSTPMARLQQVLDRHQEIFEAGLGSIQGVSAKIHVDPQAPAKSHKARPLPYALCHRVEQELERLQKDEVITPVQFSDWAAPIVPVVKKDGSIRICGDFKLTVNQAAKLDSHPLPRIEDLFASLAGGQTFSKLDLAHAYEQVSLDEDSKRFVVINTHKGLYRYNRLPFGVASAPAIFQRIMESLLQGIPHVTVYLDDVLVSGSSEEEHLGNLQEVLSRLEKAGCRVKRDKCEFMLESVEYLGYKISAEGLQPSEQKVRAIQEAPAPEDVSQLRSFLGAVNYYSKFLPNLATTLSPLYSLLQKNAKWTWGEQQESAFVRVKAQLTTDLVLVHYDPAQSLTLACDASPYGLGAVLSQTSGDGQERPVAFTSRSLAPAERKYSQIEKEGLAVVFGIKRFHQFLYGRHFVILSDHKPLQQLFKYGNSTPTLASARIQRWALILGAYHYQLVYKPGSEHANADALSRFPLPHAPTDIPTPGETILLMDMLQTMPVTAAHIKKDTDRDPVLSKVRDLILQGWKHTEEESMQPFQYRCKELSVVDGCVLWGSRVVVPQSLQSQVLEELYEGHPGTSRMKSLARSYIWWPHLDQDITQKVASCVACQSVQNLPPKAPLHPWEWPQRPWARLHADYAGPFLGKMFLIVVDAYSKWLEVRPVGSATTQATVEQLRSIFATHGLPEMFVTDNGTVFTSTEFQTFMQVNGIRHVRSAPYHPASNGLAERAVQTFKMNMKKMSQGSVETRIARFLFHYRITPHTTTGISPAALLFGRRLRSHLDFLKPDFALESRVSQRQQAQKARHDGHTQNRSIKVGDSVLVRNFLQGPKWLSGLVQESLGPVSYRVELDSGVCVKRRGSHSRSTARQPQESSW